MSVNFYQHPNVMARIFAGSIRTAMHLIMITAKAFSQRILTIGPIPPEQLRASFPIGKNAYI